MRHSHNDAVQTTGGANVTLRHNTFKLSDTVNASSVLQFGTEWGTPNSNWTVDNNLLDGDGWVFNANQPIANMIISNNRITRTHNFGIGGIDGATYSNNYYDNDLAPITNWWAGS